MACFYPLWFGSGLLGGGSSYRWVSRTGMSISGISFSHIEIIFITFTYIILWHQYFLLILSGSEVHFIIKYSRWLNKVHPSTWDARWRPSIHPDPQDLWGGAGCQAGCLHIWALPQPDPPHISLKPRNTRHEATDSSAGGYSSEKHHLWPLTRAEFKDPLQGIALWNLSKRCRAHSCLTWQVRQLQGT